MNNLFLTGEIQVGKSTLLRRFLSLAPIRYAGFRTYPVVPQDYRQGFMLAPFVSSSVEPMWSVWPDPTPIARWDGELQRWRPQVAAFEQAGVAILQQALALQPDIIIMDELGVFETEAYHFQHVVKACLQSEPPVLAVLKEKESPFLQALRQHATTHIVTVTRENRERLFETLAPRWQQRLKRS